MGIVRNSIKGIRQAFRKGKLGQTLMNDWFKDNRLNPGSWTEDLARGLGFQTRGKRPSSYKFNPHSTGYESHTDLPDSPYRPLTNTGMVAQAVGIGGAGTLGYKMFSKGDENPRDAQGIKNPYASEEMIKAREKFQKDYLGGSKKYNGSLYELTSKNSQWVKTAIENMGMDKYKKYRAAVIQDPSRAGQFHEMLVKELAKTGDTEAMKQAASEPYVLPGLANVNGKKKVVVMNPAKNKDKQTTFQALQYDYEDEEGNE